MPVARSKSGDFLRTLPSKAKLRSASSNVFAETCVKPASMVGHEVFSVAGPLGDLSMHRHTPDRPLRSVHSAYMQLREGPPLLGQRFVLTDSSHCEGTATATCIFLVLKKNIPPSRVSLLE
eukprot:4105051-Amphidinium_carterae.1